MSALTFRLATRHDVDAIITIIEQTKQLFKQSNIDQWQQGYPNRQTILDDIEKHQGYVMVDQETLVAYVALLLVVEPTYHKIYGGTWHYSGPYGTVHRIAVKESYKKRGIASLIIKHCEQQCLKNNVKVLRVDTYHQNVPAIKCFESNGFKRCGVIFLQEVFDERQARIAFDKLIV